MILAVRCSKQLSYEANDVPYHHISTEFVLVCWLVLQTKQQLWLAYEKCGFPADMKQQLRLAEKNLGFPGDSKARKWGSAFVRPDVFVFLSALCASWTAASPHYFPPPNEKNNLWHPGYRRYGLHAEPGPLVWVHLLYMEC